MNQQHLVRNRTVGVKMILLLQKERYLIWPINFMLQFTFSYEVSETSDQKR